MQHDTFPTWRSDFTSTGLDQHSQFSLLPPECTKLSNLLHKFYLTYNCCHVGLCSQLCNFVTRFGDFSDPSPKKWLSTKLAPFFDATGDFWRLWQLHFSATFFSKKPAVWWAPRISNALSFTVHTFYCTVFLFPWHRHTKIKLWTWLHLRQPQSLPRLVHYACLCWLNLMLSHCLHVCT